MFAGYEGRRLPLPADDDGAVAYLEAVIALNPANPHLQKRLQKLLAPPPAVPADADASGEEETGAGDAPAAPPVPICGTS